MNDKPIQLAFCWPHQSSAAREDFFVGPQNSDAFKMIESWPEWPARVRMIVGGSGSGKSHLGAIWAKRTGALILNAETLQESHVIEAASRPLLIEDADRVGKHEALLFHLLNQTREEGSFALLTAASLPGAWGLNTKDLLSRLRLAPVTFIKPPDENLARLVLFKMFADRQVSIEPNVVNYIALRLERSLGAARALVEALDRAAFERGCKITRSLAAQFLREDTDFPDDKED